MAKKVVFWTPDYSVAVIDRTCLPFRIQSEADAQRVSRRVNSMAAALPCPVNPAPCSVCRPQAFSLHARPGGTDLEVLDIRARRLERRVTLVAGGDPGSSAQAAGRHSSLSAVKYIHHDLERNESVHRGHGQG